MKLGIIIICYNNESDIDIKQCVKYLNKLDGIEICLVNNHSKDNTYEVLKEIKEYCNNVSVVNIKKFKSDTSAVRAGARFMFNQFNLKHLGFANLNNNHKENLSILIKDIKDHKTDILRYNLGILNETEIKLTMFQSLFPVIDFLIKINMKNEFSTMNQLG